MNCPRCTTALEELDRDGITIDLDRGELERLTTRVRDVERRRDDDFDEDSDVGGRRRRGRGSWLDIFD
jgi:Zn-finger nucleic acid-binding protein